MIVKRIAEKIAIKATDILDVTGVEWHLWNWPQVFSGDTDIWEVGVQSEEDYDKLVSAIQTVNEQIHGTTYTQPPG